MAERPKGYGMTAELREKVSNALPKSRFCVRVCVCVCAVVVCGAVS